MSTLLSLSTFLSPLPARDTYASQLKAAVIAASINHPPVSVATTAFTDPTATTSQQPASNVFHSVVCSIAKQMILGSSEGHNTNSNGAGQSYNSSSWWQISEGVQLLCLIGEAFQAAIYLQQINKWTAAAALAKVNWRISGHTKIRHSNNNWQRQIYLYFIHLFVHDE